MLTTKNTIMSETKVKPRDYVTVYGTGAGNYMKAGKEYQVHTMQADSLIAKGVATKEKPTSTSKIKNPK